MKKFDGAEQRLQHLCSELPALLLEQGDFAVLAEKTQDDVFKEHQPSLMSNHHAEHTAKEPQDVVVLIHGIRTQAAWAGMVAEVLEREVGVKVVTIKYGFFDVFRFLSPLFTRKAPVERIVRELRDLRRSYPNARISVIAHSFGTFALFKALAEPDIVLHRVVLCGSIVADDFRRATFRAQLAPDDILNDCGTHDIWPVLAKCLTWGYGATGTFGFGTVGVRDRFSQFGHSDYFDRNFVTSFWSPFLRDGIIHATDWESRRSTPPYWMSLLAWLPLRWLLATGVIFGGAWFQKRFGPAPELTFGPQVNIGHYTGFPAVVSRLNFSNPSIETAKFTALALTLISPEGKRHTLALEGNVFIAATMPALREVTVEPGKPLFFDYSFFNYDADFAVLQSDIQTMTAQLSPTLQPNPDQSVVPSALVAKARAQLDKSFIWKPGQWTMEVSYAVNEKPRSASMQFDLSDDEVMRMRRIADVYPSGIGLVQAWKFVPARGATPMIVENLSATPASK